MIGECVKRASSLILKLGVALFVLGFCLCLYPLAVLFPQSAASFFVETAAADKQGWILFCATVYFVAFTYALHRKTKFSNHSRRGLTPDVWLVVTLILAFVSGFPDHTVIARPVFGAVLLGAIIGKGARCWAAWSVPPFFAASSIALIIVLLTAVFAACSYWDLQPMPKLYYRGNTRWSGPWEGPNTFGLLMGAGVTLALGLCVWIWKTEHRTWNTAVRRWGGGGLALFATCLTGRGLFHSYSRGAWVATLCGLIYSAACWFQISGESTNERRRERVSDSVCSRGDIRVQTGPAQNRMHSADQLLFSWLRYNCFPLAAIVLSLIMLLFWRYRETEDGMMRRLLSVANANDFSSRRRLQAWEGALQFIAEKPWSGKWSGNVQDQFYRTPKTDDASAIHTNDYFMLGATSGVPTLCCFVVYLWVSLRPWSPQAFPSGVQGNEIQEGPLKAEGGRGRRRIVELKWLKSICRSGTIVLLMGFWLDGGLFSMPTAATFWILLELGRVDPANLSRAKAEWPILNERRCHNRIFARSDFHRRLV
jgi:hypothetical protein